MIHEYMKFRTVDVFLESFGNSSLGRVQSVIQICLREAQNNDQTLIQRKLKKKFVSCVRELPKMRQSKGEVESRSDLLQESMAGGREELRRVAEIGS